MLTRIPTCPICRTKDDEQNGKHERHLFLLSSRLDWLPEIPLPYSIFETHHLPILYNNINYRKKKKWRDLMLQKDIVHRVRNMKEKAPGVLADFDSFSAGE